MNNGSESHGKKCDSTEDYHSQIPLSLSCKFSVRLYFFSIPLDEICDDPDMCNAEKRHLKDEVSA